MHRDGIRFGCEATMGSRKWHACSHSLGATVLGICASPVARKSDPTDRGGRVRQLKCFETAAR
jgi:hypothetical protein